MKNIDIFHFFVYTYFSESNSKLCRFNAKRCCENLLDLQKKGNNNRLPLDLFSKNLII